MGIVDRSVPIQENMALDRKWDDRVQLKEEGCSKTPEDSKPLIMHGDRHTIVLSFRETRVSGQIQTCEHQSNTDTRLND